MLIWLLLLLVLAPVSATALTEEPVCSDPNVIFCDNFNDRPVANWAPNFSPPNLGGKTSGWSTDATGGMGITTSGCLEGNCLFQTYFQTPHVGDNGGGGFMGTQAFPKNQTIYYRIWIQYPSNWVESSNGSKMLYAESPGQNPSLNGGARQALEADPGGWPMLERAQCYTTSVGCAQDPLSTLGETRLHANMNQSFAGKRIGQWQCIEWRLTHETTTTPSFNSQDGILQAWVNDPAGGPDVQVMGFSGISFNAFDANSDATYYSDYLISSYWNCGSTSNCLDAGNGHPQMIRLIDRVVISKARIGCGGGGTAPTPPGAPINLSVS